MLAEKRADRAAFHEEEKEELLAEMEALSSKLEEARHRISQLQEDESMIEEFKLKLECADDSREAREKNIIETFERKISLLTLDKDVTNDKLRKELISEREANAEEIAELNEQLKVHQQEVMQLREELDEQTEQRETRIFELEHTLEAQEQLVQNMKSEMDHLQGSMEGNAARRKEEIEEMQKELLDMTAAAAKHEREIESLKGELDTSKVNHEAELAKLKKKLSETEGAKEKNRNAQDLQMELRVKEVKDRLEKLKFRNSSLKVENINLRERLERAENLMKENDQPEKIKSLQSELDSQSRKIKKLETELERAREPPAESRTSGRSRSLSTTRIRPPSRKPPVSTTPLKRSDMSVISSNTTAVSTSPERKGFFSRFRSRSLSRDPTSRQAQTSVPAS
jgi:chromosome segregation ATPase